MKRSRLFIAILPVLFVVITLLSITNLRNINEGGIVCDIPAEVSVSVFNIEGSIFEAAPVLFSRNGNNWQASECFKDLSPQNCMYHIVRITSPGKYTIKTEYPDHDSDQFTVQVTWDNGTCQSFPDSGQLLLAPVGTKCELVSHTSVFVSVLDETGTPMSENTVKYTIDSGPEKLATTGRGGLYQIEWDLPGLFVITASRSGYTPVTKAVTVPMDNENCHVVTQDVDFILIKEN